MRLLNITTRKLEYFLGDPPPYAILSHTWGPGEITLQDLNRDDLDKKPGWIKIVGFLKALVKRLPEPIEYAWIDTSCIDKTSSAELSEAINAMFLWYKHSECCYAYLEDVEHAGASPVGKDFEECRWFDRGWTLQELLAPRQVEFFDRKWCYIGSKHELAERISLRTNIDEKSLLTGDFTSASVARRMSWAGGRQTTRSEDLAYCLLGIFDINMPMLYGEGEKAFTRLQEEILKEYDDQSIFAWDSSKVPSKVATVGVLATHPSQFKDSSAIEPHPSSGEPLAITNKGIQADLALIEQQSNPGQLIGLLSCISQGDMASAVGIALVRSSSDREQYSRTRSAPIQFGTRVSSFKRQRVYLTKRSSASGREGWATTCWLRYGPENALKPVKEYPFSYWHRSTTTQTMTMTMPYATCASSDSILAAAAFRVTASGDCFSLFMDLKPRERAIKVKLVAVDIIPDGIELDKLLEKLGKEPHANGNTLVLSGGKVTVEGSVQLIRGSWIYNVAISAFQ